MGSSPGSGSRSSSFRPRDGDVRSESLPELQSVIAIVNLKAPRSYFSFAYCFTTGFLLQVGERMSYPFSAGISSSLAPS